MAGREDRIRIFEGTMALWQGHESLKRRVADSIAGQRLYWQEEEVECRRDRFGQPAALFLSAKRSMEAARPYAKQGRHVCVLNFASSVAPGGGVVQGASAQEESLCRISTLYPAISNEASAGDFYKRHWAMIRSGEMKRENRDDCIFTPEVMVVRGDDADCALLPEAEWYEVSVITCAAPDLRRTTDGSQYSPTEEELCALHERRFRRILSVAARHQAEVLILGAFGCGVFANPPEIVVRAFNHVFGEFRYCFEAVEFAVYAPIGDSDNYRAFAGIDGIRTAE